LALEKIAAMVALSGVMAYAIFGGADFGSGIWSALASGPRAGQQRNALYKAIGPVWETNNVWLVFIVVVLLMAFPGALADLSTALLVPLSVGLIGIVFRGAGFAFRNYSRESGVDTVPLYSVIFAVASVITPFAFGVALGATGGGEIKLNDGAVTSGLFAPWLHPFPILFGLTVVCACAFLTMSYMTTRSSGDLREDFRLRGLLAGVVESTVRALGRGSIRAALGPAIGPCCFEVSDEVAAHFRRQFGREVASGRNVNLWLAAERALGKVGCESVERIEICTSCHPELFFSHRRDQGLTGRQGVIGAIG